MEMCGCVRTSARDQLASSRVAMSALLRHFPFQEMGVSFGEATSIRGSACDARGRGDMSGLGFHVALVKRSGVSTGPSANDTARRKSLAQGESRDSSCGFAAVIALVGARPLLLAVRKRR